jgi:hypothetical protein
MKALFHRQESDTQQSGSFLAPLQQVLDDLQKWLIRIFWLTEEEQKEAGVYIDGQRHE